MVSKNGKARRQAPPRKGNLAAMKRRKFEEEVVEETTVTEETTEESTPDSHEQFITLLTDMGLSAEQAEAIHQMAMDLIDNSPEQSGEENKVEASRARRGGYSRGGSRRMGSGGRRRMGHGPSRRRGMSAHRGRSLRRFDRDSRPGRQDFAEPRMQRQLRRQRREIMELRAQLRELGAQPGAARLNTAPKTEMSTPVQVPTQGSPKDRVMAMLKHTF